MVVTMMYFHAASSPCLSPWKPTSSAEVMVVPSMAIQRMPRLSESTVTTMVATKACTSAKYQWSRSSRSWPRPTSWRTQPTLAMDLDLSCDGHRQAEHGQRGGHVQRRQDAAAPHQQHEQGGGEGEERRDPQ